MSSRRLLVVLVLVCAAALYWVLDLGQYLSLAYLAEQRNELAALISADPLYYASLYLLVYIGVTALSVPAAWVLTVFGGALFGLFWGSVLASIASTAGASLAFLASRSLFRDWVQGRFGRYLAAINAGVEKDGAYYLFTLRLVPLFPFFAINLIMGLTPIRLWQFFLVSQVGMLPGTIVYVNAGTQLAGVEQGADFLSPALIGSFVLLGLFPWLARGALNAFKRRRALAAFSKPASFDTNLVVIGAGSAGLVASLIAATVKAEVTLVEKHRMGGDCLNTGCIPSKTLIRSAGVRHLISRAEEFGMAAVPAAVDFPKVMARVKSVIQSIEPHDSVERFTGLGVDCLEGEATLLSPWQVQVGERVISARNIIIASGARPLVPPFPGLDEVPWSSSDSVWELEALPARLLVLGGGPIGCELAQSFARLGSRVAIVDMAPTILPREDSDVVAELSAQFGREGIEVYADHKVLGFNHAADGSYTLSAEHAGQTVALTFDHVLVAIGRKPNTEGLGLETLGIELTAQGTIAVDDYLRTSIPTIYACGDVAGPYQFTHMASHQAWYASVNALFGSLRKFKVDYSVVPWATFTDPEVARVGLSEKEAAEQGIDVEVTCYDLGDHDRALADGDAKGFVKVLTAPGSDRILGAVIVGAHAGELINEFVLAMRHKLGLNKILASIHIYPTWSESAKFAAGNWRKARAPERLLGFVERYHRWRRN